MKDQIRELLELILKQEHRIASLENQMRRQNEMFSERLNEQKQSIESEIERLKAEIIAMKEVNDLHQREKAELASRIALIEKHVEEKIRIALEVGLRSEADKISKLKADLISQSVLPERFLFSTADPFEGIIAHLTRECGGNVADRGIVGITASSVLDVEGNPKYVADLTDIWHYFTSKNEANSWIEWDFKTVEIEPTHYSIRIHTELFIWSVLQNWILEGRNGQEEWRVLDERQGDSQLIGQEATFDIRNRMRIRMIRLRQTGPNHDGSHVLKILALELFGELLRHSS
jgi:hypothetical protein